MKKKHITLIIAIVLAVLLIVAIWCVGYFSISKYLKQSDYKYFLDIASDYIYTDSDFENQYGKPISITEYEDMEVIAIEQYECRIPCYVKVKSGDTYLVWIGYKFPHGGEETFYYHTVELIS